jgi:hypothetical protein
MNNCLIGLGGNCNNIDVVVDKPRWLYLYFVNIIISILFGYNIIISFHSGYAIFGRCNTRVNII